MNKIQNEIHQLYKVEEKASQNGWLSFVHPSIKVWLTILYIVLVISCGPMAVGQVFGMGSYLLVWYILGELSFLEGLKRMKIAFPFLFLVGMWNPILDHEILFKGQYFTVTTGWVSFITLLLKGLFALLSVYSLVVTTTMEQIGQALSRLHVPKILITITLLIYRFLGILMEEASHLSEAYSLRAPGQKGIQISSWGPLVGQLLLRSTDRAEQLYESMCLRGYDGGNLYQEGKRLNAKQWIMIIFISGIWLLLRFTPVFALVGSLFVKH